MDVWNYRGQDSWSFVAINRPGDHRIFSGRNNNSNRLVYSRSCLRKKGDFWVEGKSPTHDFIIYPQQAPKTFIPILEVKEVVEWGEAMGDIFNPWFLVKFPEPLAKVPIELTNNMLQGLMAFRANPLVTTTPANCDIIGLALSSITDATCLAGILECDFYDTRKLDAA